MSPQWFLIIGIVLILLAAVLIVLSHRARVRARELPPARESAQQVIEAHMPPRGAVPRSVRERYEDSRYSWRSDDPDGTGSRSSSSS